MDSFQLGFAFLLHGLNFVAAGLSIRFFLSFKKHLVFCSLVLWLFVFTWISPFLGTYVFGYSELYSISFLPYLLPTLQLYALSTSAFLLLYLLACYFHLPRWKVFSRAVRVEHLSLIYLVLATLLTGNYLSVAFRFTHFNVLDVFAHQGSFYLEALAESIILFPLVAYIMGGRSRKHLLATALVVAPFLVLTGWRYRIILFVLVGLCWLVLRVERWDWKRVARWTGILVACVFLFIMISLNRWALQHNKLDHWRWDPRELGYDFVVRQTSNYQFMALSLALRDQWPAHRATDFFKAPLIRAVPSFIYPEKKDYLPTQIDFIINRAAEPNAIGSADPDYHSFTVLGTFFFHFGVYFGPAIAVFFLFFISYLPIHGESSYSRILYVGWAAFMFHLISRGFLPQHLEFVAYYFAPFWLYALIKRFRSGLL